jgi:hypothetical protein
MFEDYRSRFAGLPVVDFPFRRADPLPEVEPDAVAWRLRLEISMDDENHNDFAERFTAFLEQVDVSRVRALVIGMTAYMERFDSELAVRLLAEHAAAFPSLRALFLGDVVVLDAEVSWINHVDLMPVLESYPLLEELHVRGGEDQWNPHQGAVRPFKHEALRKLVFESGGLPPTTVRAVGESAIPELEHLEFYLGDEDYGGGTTVEDLASWLVEGETFPKLRHLGLRDAPNADEIAAALAQSPVVARLATLDLSLGALGDEGAAALLAGQPLHHLSRLDLHYHFLSDEMTERLREALPGIDLDLSEQQQPEDWGDEQGRYIAVSE